MAGDIGVTGNFGNVFIMEVVMTQHTYASLRRKGLVLLAGTAIAAGTGGTASAISSNNFKYNTAKRGYFSIHAMAMAPDGTGAANDYSINWNGSALSSGTARCFNTGVHLPQGAKIVNVKVAFSSNAQSELIIALRRNTLLTGDNVVLLSGIVADDSDTRVIKTLTTPPADSSVNNRDYVYGFGACVAPGTTFYGASIMYKYRNAGD